MLVRPINDQEIEKWELFVEDNPTIAWQSYHWNTVVSKHYHTKFFPLAAFNNDRICGILPLYAVQTIKKKIKLISVPYAVGGGLYADNSEAEKALLDAAISLYQTQSAQQVILKQYKHKIQGPLRTDANFYNRELDLTVGPDRIYNNFEEINKAKIEEGEKYKLSLNYPTKDIDRFYRLLLQHHRLCGIPCVGKKWIEDLIQFGMYNMALLRSDGKVVAGTLVKEHKLSVSFPFTSIPDFSERSIMFAYNLYWLLLKKFSADGKAIFHSGRIPNNNDTFSYRLGWNGNKNNYYYQYYPDTSGTSEFGSKRGRKRQVVSAIWKRLPAGLTAIIGPQIVKYYP